MPHLTPLAVPSKPAASSFYYFQAFKPQYMRLVNMRQAAFSRQGLPLNGLRTAYQIQCACPTRISISPPAPSHSVCRDELPLHPLRSLLGTAAASLVLALVIHLLAVRFAIDTWAEALQMAAALLIIDACLNARCVAAQLVMCKFHCAECDLCYVCQPHGICEAVRHAGLPYGCRFAPTQP